MIILKFIWISIQVFIGFQLVFPLLLAIIKEIRGRDKHIVFTNILPDYAVIITAYEQTDQLPEVVDSVLAMGYDNYLIYVVADNCDISNLNFSSEKVVLLRPDQVLAGNVRSHFHAIKNFKRNHTHLTIIDSDNLVSADYLNVLNTYFQAGYQAVQGVRNAKNIDTMYARLDAARDIYYHYYDGKVLFGAGSSATLAGSGMAFTTRLYRECLENLDISGAGFDKVLQHAIVSRGHRIAFAENAIVLDEKTTGSEQLVNQRARWINTWFRYFSLGFGLLGSGITKFDWNKFLFGLVLIRPPLFIFLLLSVLFMLINLIFEPIAAVYWLMAMIIFVAGFFLSLAKSQTDQKIYQSLKGIPQFMFFQILSLLKVKRANKISVATKHNVKRV
ncbi:glycosyltransferase [Dyadobacter subterraneus]|uniref:Glycosyltransferase family 2 protein n=1 Tax=Dyadobacter subterraneus TaxID=2773304 RepID=A0ABR9WCC6_9BACT|nr:glycosyltransferase [Dyadobacter subterraneus]MBE9463133.1 glycosyltransferase family 2 protein [Dyadobacter subterraneus]